MFRRWYLLALVFSSASLVYFAGGCNRESNPGKAVPQLPDTKVQEARKNKPAKKEDDHAHKAGTNGGIIVSLGADSYHVEAVFETGGLLKLFTLGKDEARVFDVESQILKAYVKEEGASEAVPMELNPVPRAGDKTGRTSQFVGRVPTALVGKQVAVTIPIIAIDGERFRLAFASSEPKHDEGMPIVVRGVDENELYLKPGGIYNEADIKANGSVTASQKFKGILSKHDMTPKAGEKICPITLTKANPQYTWVVGGKTYEFCCPPCVDEFVAQAKDPQRAKDIKEPDQYVKRK
jgi:hypothetical protein